MSNPSDWRLQGQEKYLLGAKLQRSRYVRYRWDWDHDHCEFCGVKFAEERSDLEIQTAGYCTPDKYRWVCSQCFEDFRERFSWEVVPGQEGVS